MTTLKHCSDAKWFVCRIIWVLIVLTGLILFIKQLVDSILFYRTFPVAVDVKINYNDTLLFPAITMCNINSFR